MDEATDSHWRRRETRGEEKGGEIEGKVLSVRMGEEKKEGCEVYGDLGSLGLDLGMKCTFRGFFLSFLGGGGSDFILFEEKKMRRGKLGKRGGWRNLPVAWVL